MSNQVIRSVWCLALFLAPPGAVAQPDGAAKPAREAGPKLTLTIRCEARGLKVGDEIPITFEIQNQGATPYQYGDRNHDRSGRMPEYELTAVDDQNDVVVDPRANRRPGPQGGLTPHGDLAPGKTFTRNIALNRWALLKEPGAYRVTGTYHTFERRSEIVSTPLLITVLPRTDRQMAAYIEGLSAELAATTDGDARGTLVRKLMYTCDRRTVPVLIEAIYRSDVASYWASEAFGHYLPRNDEIDEALLNAARDRGLLGGMTSTLRQRGFTEEELVPLIEISLAPARPRAWVEGALLAQVHPDDRYTPRLVAIATNPKSEARPQAIHALANNRTERSVRVLKELLEDPDRRIREDTERAIRSAYRFGKGRRLRQGDFEARLQGEK